MDFALTSASDQNQPSGAGNRLSSPPGVFADTLVFDEDERGPQTDDLKLAFEAVSQFDPEDKAMAKKIIQGLIMQHQNKQLSAALDTKTR